MLRATEKITALYCRLSVEDTKDEKKNGKEDPSNSIQHQQVMLMQYAKANRLPNPTYFIDDGYSGVTYDRPGFQKMLSEIEAGNVGTVITKDLSRLGRNSALTGLYINYTFPQYGVRYIAVNDHFDTWDKKQRDNPVENRKVFYNTHPAIISLEVFDKVQEIRQQRHRRTATGKSNMFCGLVFCNDCKQKLYYSTTNYFEKRQDFFICSTHRTNKDKCSGHYIRAVVLEQQVWKHIQEVISVVTRYEAYFRSEMEEKLRVQSEETLRIHKKRLAQAEKRISELDRLFIRSYEDNVSGKIDDERFAMMNKSYTQEQKDLKAEVISLQQVIEEQERQAENLEQFIQRVKRNSELTELTPYALRELVKAVYVEAPDKSSGKRKQKIHISYDLIGFIPVDVLTKAEQA